MAINVVNNGGADLSEFRFTSSFDVGTARNVVTTLPDILDYSGLSNDIRPVSTGLGVDFVRGALQATATTANVSFPSYNGLASSQDLSTDAGADRVVGRLTLNAVEEMADASGAGLRVAPTMLDGTVTLSTWTGNDVVRGFAAGSSNQREFGSLSVGGIDNSGVVSLGNGADRMIGIASVRQLEGSAAQISASGIGSAFVEDGNGEFVDKEGTIFGGAGNDSIIGNAEIDGQSNLNGSGISLQTIIAGTGDDLISASATADAFNGGSVSILPAMIRVTARTGDGDDRVIAESSVSALANATIGDISGFLVSDITTGSGDDLISTLVQAGGKENSSITNINGSNDSEVFDMDLSSGAGSDKIISRIFVSADEGSTISGVNGFLDSTIDAGGSADVIRALVRVTVFDNSDVSDISGIRSSVLAKSGDDFVLGETVIRSFGTNTDISSVGINLERADDGSSFVIDTDDGADRVVGIAETFAVQPELAVSTGIFGGEILTGKGDDQVIGKGSVIDFVNNVPTNSQSIGISQTFIALGRGDDFVKARGDMQGVSDVLIFGADGDDTFDIQSGTGEIHGGSDTDTLILEGSKDDYTFTSEGLFEGNIADGGVTDLKIGSVEFFRFDNGVFTYDALFG